MQVHFELSGRRDETEPLYFRAGPMRPHSDHCSHTVAEEGDGMEPSNEAASVAGHLQQIVSTPAAGQKHP